MQVFIENYIKRCFIHRKCNQQKSFFISRYIFEKYCFKERFLLKLVNCYSYSKYIESQYILSSVPLLFNQVNWFN